MRKLAENQQNLLLGSRQQAACYAMVMLELVFAADVLPLMQVMMGKAVEAIERVWGDGVG